MHNKYVINRNVFDSLLKEKGYKNYIDFCQTNNIHKNTLNYYLSGKDDFSDKLYVIASKLDVEPVDIIKPEKGKVSNFDEIKQIAGELTLDESVAVILLGSRARGNFKKYSDWDIGITKGEKRIEGRAFLRLKGRISELAENLPRKVELINLDAAPNWFLDSIDYSLIFLGGNLEAFYYMKGVTDGLKRKQA